VLLRTFRKLRGLLHDTVDAAVLVRRGLRLGRDVYLAPGTIIDPDFCWLVEIGDETTLGPGVRVLAHDASTKRHLGYSRVGRVTIGRRVFIGADSIILPGVEIGDEAIIGAGSVVRRDVPDGVVVAGNPAVLVGNTEDYIDRHRDRLDDRPIYHRDGYTLRRGITEAAKRQMLDELAEETGYVH
jgi:maltose O-acetyltransferase